MTKIPSENFLTHVTKKWIKISEKIIEKKKIRNAFKFRKLSKTILVWLSKIRNVNAPKITGIASILEKNTECSLVYPLNLINVIIAPDLLTPGIKAIHWLKPIKIELLGDKLSKFLTLKQNLSTK